MQIYIKEDKAIKNITLSLNQALPGNILWIDLLNISSAEEKYLEKLLKIDIPTPKETHNIFVSNRLYEEHNAIYMTITLYLNKDNDISHLEPHTITFVLIKDILITIRDISCNLFTNFSNSIETKCFSHDNTGCSLLLMLLERIINDTAAFLEQIGHKLDAQSENILNNGSDNNKTSYKVILKEIANIGNTVSKTRESLISFSRLLTFLSQAHLINHQDHFNTHLQGSLQDISALSDHASFLSSKISFLLDATLGLINIEQNGIIKIFSVASVIFLPPTLIASIYGMNFEVMPELKWISGYPLALLLMLLSAILPYKYFKKKKWL